VKCQSIHNRKGRKEKLPTRIRDWGAKRGKKESPPAGLFGRRIGPGGKETKKKGGVRVSLPLLICQRGGKRKEKKKKEAGPGSRPSWRAEEGGERNISSQQ